MPSVHKAAEAGHSHLGEELRKASDSVDRQRIVEGNDAFERLVQSQSAEVKQDLHDLSLELGTAHMPPAEALPEKTKGLMGRLFDKMRLFRENPSIVKEFDAWTRERGSRMRSGALAEIAALVLGPGFVGQDRTVEVSPARPGGVYTEIIPGGEISYDEQSSSFQGVYRDKMAKGYNVEAFDTNDSENIENNDLNHETILGAVLAIKAGAKIVRSSGWASEVGGVKNMNMAVGEQRAERFEQAVKEMANQMGVDTTGVEFISVDNGTDTTSSSKNAQRVEVETEGMTLAPISLPTEFERHTPPIPAEHKTVRDTLPVDMPADGNSFPADQAKGQLYGEYPPKAETVAGTKKREKEDEQKLLTDKRPKYKMLTFDPDSSSSSVVSETPQRVPLLTRDQPPTDKDRIVHIPDVIDEDKKGEEPEIVDTELVPRKQLRGPERRPALPKPEIPTEEDSDEEEDEDEEDDEDPVVPNTELPRLTYDPGETPPPPPPPLEKKPRKIVKGPNALPKRQGSMTRKMIKEIDNGDAVLIGKGRGKSKIREKVQFESQGAVPEAQAPDVVDLDYADYQKLREEKGIDIKLQHKEPVQHDIDTEEFSDADDEAIYTNAQRGNAIRTGKGGKTKRSHRNN